eukprot:NODE_18976_length_865_cov_7.773713.p2 GENE.NODE_18976_length_865_cov_7.773713~~NODE_18976_length_865_cov_7.773713.p2  ORF type:complete len:139 (+),score=19.45 NODE_18976_length_865_cov_7.773713:378-794(+)
MLEHVGPSHFGVFFKSVAEVLKPGGVFFLEVIGQKECVHSVDAWIDKYIFPGGVIPCLSYIAKGFEPYFRLQNFDEVGLDYSRTMRGWMASFASNWSTTLHKRYREADYRLWEYYITMCSAAFATRDLYVFQLQLVRL